MASTVVMASTVQEPRRKENAPWPDGR
jgi:hypothetical protein